MKNKFFNQNDFDFQVLGFFEEYLDADSRKCYGVKEVATADRHLGYAGREVRVLTEPVVLQRGHKAVTLKASQEKPIKVITMLQAKGGHVRITKPISQKVSKLRDEATAAHAVYMNTPVEVNADVKIKMKQAFAAYEAAREEWMKS